MVYILVIILLVILFQDVWFRGIYWFLFPAVLFLSIWVSYDFITFERLALNLSFLTLLMGTLTIYLSIKNNQLMNITNGYFSWGDILFLLAIVPLFEPYLFVLFFTTGTIVALLIHLVSSLFSAQKTIPYAGYMALWGATFLIFKESIHQMIYLG